MLRTERDVIETLAGRAVTMGELYDACQGAGVHVRDDGDSSIPDHGGDTIWRRRARNAIQAMKRSGRARRVGPSTWMIDGDRDTPLHALLVLTVGELGPVELHMSDAATLLDRLHDEGVVVDLVLADPPWALERGRGEQGVCRNERIYRRDHTKVLRDGYVEVDAGAYREFTHRWVESAARLLEARPGGYLAVITGPQQAARVQVAAEDAGLTFVNQVVARKIMPLPTTRRFAHSHYVVTICSSGKPESAHRFFHSPPELPAARSGRPYPRDWWENVGRADRPGLLRYDNQLPVELVSRTIRSLTRGPDSQSGPAWGSLVVDPMTGGGTSAVAAYETGRRFIGGDLNPAALRFTMARLLREHVDVGRLDFATA